MKNIILKWYKLILLLVVIILIIVMIILMPKGETKSNETSDSISKGLESVTEEDAEPDHAEILDNISVEEDDGETIFLIPKEDVKSFSIIEANDVMLNFERNNNQWIYIDQPDLKFNQDRLDKILNYLCDVRYISIISAENGEEYGLSQNSKAYTVTDSANNTIFISIGNIDEETGNLYFAMNYDFTTIFVNSGRLNNISDYSVDELTEK